MQGKIFNIIVEEGIDGYFISTVVELPGCHTQAKTPESLIERTKEAIELYIGEKKKYKPVSKFVKVQQIEL